jgi:hypothetical protein
MKKVIQPRAIPAMLAITAAILVCAMATTADATRKASGAGLALGDRNGMLLQVQQPQPGSEQEVPVGSSFTYQGRLKDGPNPANGQYDFAFKLFDVPTGGAQVGPTITRFNQTVSEGLVTISLDFGATALQGQARYMEVGVKTTSEFNFTTLTPRQPVSPAPYAMGLKPATLITNTYSSVRLGSILRGVEAESMIGSAVQGISTSSGGEGVYGIAHNGATAAGVEGYSTSGFGVHGIGTSNNGSGVYGESDNGYGVHGSSDSDVGVMGESDSARGVYGLSNSHFGVHGESTSNTGVRGSSTSGLGVHGSSDSNTGVRGVSTDSNGMYGSSANGVGVRGVSTSNTGVYGSSTNGIGVRGESASGFSVGVQGESLDTGVHGIAEGRFAGPTAIGVRGTGGGPLNIGIGVYGESESYAGIYGTTDDPNGEWAGYFAGNVQVTGSCCGAGAGISRTDHPLNPANKYLSHAYMESPDMKTVYDGNVTTGASGEAVVALPDYVEALNRDFRYQLTIIGDEFAQARVSSKIKDNRFTIKTDKPDVEVSWQVTGIRKDAYAEAHPIAVEEDKGEDQGNYLHPTEHGQPESMGIDYEERHATEKQP